MRPGGRPVRRKLPSLFSFATLKLSDENMASAAFSGAFWEIADSARSDFKLDLFGVMLALLAHKSPEARRELKRVLSRLQTGKPEIALRVTVRSAAESGKHAVSGTGRDAHQGSL